MFDEQTLLKNALAAWTRHHAMTYSFLDSLTDAQLYAPHPKSGGLDTFAKHFEEMADVQNAYALAFHTHRLDFSMLPTADNYPGTTSRQGLKAGMEQADQAIYAGIDACSGEQAIDIFGNPCARADLIQTLLHHELFHHGQIRVLTNLMKIDLPKDWRDFWWIAPVSGNE